MITVLFACVHNTGRSQMAEAFFNRLADPTKARAVSGGTEPAKGMNPTVIGEALVDVLASGIAPAQEFVGGSPLNVAVSLARLGYPGTLISRWGADDKGRKIEEYLKSNNVKYLGGADEEATVIAHGILDPAGGAAFAFNAYWQMPTIGPELPQDVELVHTGSIATLFSPDELLPLLSAARTHATISYDPNLRPSLVTNHAQTVAEVERFVGQADVVGLLHALAVVLELLGLEREVRLERGT